MLLRVTHETRYAYTPPVETAQHMAYLRPRELPRQALLEHALEITPEPAQRSESVDVYGNGRAFFALESQHDTLVVTARSLVRTHAGATAGPGAADRAWEQVREHYRYRKDAPHDPAAEFVFASHHVPRHDAFSAYARASFAPGRPLFEATLDLTRRMHADFIYDGDSTQVNTPAVQALAQRRGVCQDFAHIMIGCLRTLGLPARYVSGYLLTQPPPGQPRLLGSDASHAWVSAYLPGADGQPGTWADFDPTNGRQPGEDYVVLAMGRDFANVSPMRGVLHGGAGHTLAVAVTVEPADEAGADDTHAGQPPARGP